jgi:hypothetical protein
VSYREYRIEERPRVRYFVATSTTGPVLAVIPHVGPGELVGELPEV